MTAMPSPDVICPDVLCLGEVLIDFMPAGPAQPGVIGAFDPAPGGAPANVAVGLARLGVRSAFMGRTAADGFGRFLARALTNAGVDVSRLRLGPDTKPPVAFVSHDEEGLREFLFYASRWPASPPPTSTSTPSRRPVCCIAAPSA